MEYSDVIDIEEYVVSLKEELKKEIGIPREEILKYLTVLNTIQFRRINLGITIESVKIVNVAFNTNMNFNHGYSQLPNSFNILRNSFSSNNISSENVSHGIHSDNPLRRNGKHIVDGLSVLTYFDLKDNILKIVAPKDCQYILKHLKYSSTNENLRSLYINNLITFSDMEFKKGLITLIRMGKKLQTILNNNNNIDQSLIID